MGIKSIKKEDNINIISKKTVYQNPWIKVIEERFRQNRRQGFYGIVEINDSIGVIAQDELGRIILVKIYRYPIKKFSWEIPTGGSKKGETPLVAAKRELKEETGFRAKNWQKLGSFYPYPAIATERCFGFLAKKLSGKKIERTEEVYEAKFFPKDRILAMIKNGTIIDGLTICCLANFFLKEGLK